MPQPAVAAEIHQPLDIHGDFAPQVALDHVIAVDDLTDLQYFLVGQLRHPAGLRDSDFLHDFIGLSWPNPMDILQCNNHPFVGRYVDAGDAGHSQSLLLPTARTRPAGHATRGGSHATPSPFRRARYRSTSRLGWGLLMD